MTMHPYGEHVAGAPEFDAMMAEVTAAAERFGHREHVHLTWLAVRRVGVHAAVGLVSDGIQRTARYAGTPQKYHATISRAWVELVGHHVASPQARTGWVEPDLAPFPWQDTGGGPGVVHLRLG